MTMLVYIQQSDGIVPKTSLAAITAAMQIKDAYKKDKVVALVLGSGAEAASQSIAQFGFSEVLWSDETHLVQYFAPHYVKALLKGCSECGADCVVTTASSTGKDLMPRFSAVWDAGQASDIIGVLDGVLKRPMYAGDVIADVEITSARKVITVRASAFPQPVSAGSSPVRKISCEAEGANLGKVVEYQATKAERPELGGASIVVSGGRALQSSENFEKYIFPLADSLGAAVGASRAAVDSGYAPNDWQVGQTGKIVAPNLYVAVGISGAIQHLAGMKDSKVIVAINKDGDAPIFEVADYGLVADLYDAVPKLTEEIKKAKGA